MLCLARLLRIRCEQGVSGGVVAGRLTIAAVPAHDEQRAILRDDHEFAPAGAERKQLPTGHDHLRRTVMRRPSGVVITTRCPSRRVNIKVDTGGSPFVWGGAGTPWTFTDRRVVTLRRVTAAGWLERLVGRPCPRRAGGGRPAFFRHLHQHSVSCASGRPVTPFLSQVVKRQKLLTRRLAEVELRLSS
jgi:hypothetical protein